MTGGKFRNAQGQGLVVLQLLALFVGHHEWMRIDGGANSLGEFSRLFDWRVGQDDQEFLASEASKDVVLADNIFNDIGGLSQNMIAGIVPVSVLLRLNLISASRLSSK